MQQCCRWCGRMKAENVKMKHIRYTQRPGKTNAIFSRVSFLWLLFLRVSAFSIFSSLFFRQRQKSNETKYSILNGCSGWAGRLVGRSLERQWLSLDWSKTKKNLFVIYYYYFLCRSFNENRTKETKTACGKAEQQKGSQLFHSLSQIFRFSSFARFHFVHFVYFVCHS